MWKSPYSLCLEDQRDRFRIFGKNGTRTATNEEIRALEDRDELRRAQLREYLKHNALKNGRDYYGAAMLLHHGTKKQYGIAHRYARKATRLDYHPAIWLTAASLDRYLRSLGRRQKFGTQFYVGQDGTWKIWPYRKHTTDEERKRYNVEPLKDLLAYARRLNKN